MPARGGLAQELSALEMHQGQESTAVLALSGPILFLVGSLSEVCKRQCAVLIGEDQIQEFLVPATVLRDGPSHPQWAANATRLRDLLDDGNDVLVQIGQDDHFNPAEGPALATMLGRLIQPLFSKVGAAVLIGGESARAMLSEVDVLQLQILAELEPGVPLSMPSERALSSRPLIVTKAGAFGDDRTLQRVRATLRGGSIHLTSYR